MCVAVCVSVYVTGSSWDQWYEERRAPRCSFGDRASVRPHPTLRRSVKRGPCVHVLRALRCTGVDWIKQPHSWQSWLSPLQPWDLQAGAEPSLLCSTRPPVIQDTALYSSKSHWHTFFLQEHHMLHPRLTRCGFRPLSAFSSPNVLHEF